MDFFKKITVLAFSLLIMSCFVSCVSDNEEMMQTVDSNSEVTPQKINDSSKFQLISITENKKSSADLYIRTDVPKCNVYINNNYKGRSPLLITDLVPGYYVIMVEYAQNPGERLEISGDFEFDAGLKYEYYIEK